MDMASRVGWGLRRSCGGGSNHGKVVFVQYCVTLLMLLFRTGAQALADGLKDKPNLAAVSFRGNGIGVEGMSGNKWRRAGMVVGENGKWQVPLA